MKNKSLSMKNDSKKKKNMEILEQRNMLEMMKQSLGT